MNRLMVAILLILLSITIAVGKTPLGNRIAGLPDTIIEISGIVIAPPPCQINNDKPADVDFGDVTIQYIDGERYMRDIPAVIQCPPTFIGELNFKIRGEPSPFDESALITSNPDLAIRLTLNGGAMKLDQWQSISWRTPLEIKAVPIKNSNSIPAAGPFTVTATMLIAVQ
ncbi:fimbrial protein [Pantoea sp. NPDC088449]|uniref:fimbrial protein n=1 Tax=Pantoea sp. NPDC088449 TaxID=3364392 RepID=UPI000EBE3EED|nr:pilus assembly protein [Pantoea sp.]